MPVMSRETLCQSGSEKCRMYLLKSRRNDILWPTTGTVGNFPVVGIKPHSSVRENCLEFFRQLVQ
jgi:hypothetical protein